MAKRTTGEGPNPSGLCMCGRGNPTAVAKVSDKRDGIVAGEPRRYIKGHHMIQHTGVPVIPNPSGICMCGCGLPVPRAKTMSRRLGLVRGEYVRYLPRHFQSRKFPEYRHDPITGCWEWTKAKTRGYGRVTINCRNRMAYRVYYEEAFGPIPEGMVIDHLCRNTGCVNPMHLEVVTTAENNRRGDLATLNHDSARALVSAYSHGDGSMREMGERFGVTQATAQRAVSGTSWTD